jgi:hypothetical protein
MTMPTTRQAFLSTINGLFNAIRDWQQKSTINHDLYNIAIYINFTSNLLAQVTLLPNVALDIATATQLLRTITQATTQQPFNPEFLRDKLYIRFNRALSTADIGALKTACEQFKTTGAFHKISMIKVTACENDVRNNNRHVFRINRPLTFGKFIWNCVSAIPYRIGSLLVNLLQPVFEPSSGNTWLFLSCCCFLMINSPAASIFAIFFSFVAVVFLSAVGAAILSGIVYGLYDIGCNIYQYFASPTIEKQDNKKIKKPRSIKKSDNTLYYVYENDKNADADVLEIKRDNENYVLGANITFGINSADGKTTIINEQKLSILFSMFEIIADKIERSNTNINENYPLQININAISPRLLIKPELSDGKIATPLFSLVYNSSSLSAITSVNLEFVDYNIHIVFPKKTAQEAPQQSAANATNTTATAASSSDCVEEIVPINRPLVCSLPVYKKPEQTGDNKASWVKSDESIDIFAATPRYMISAIV